MEKNILSNKVLFKKLRTKYGSKIHIFHRQGKETMIYYEAFDFSKIFQTMFFDESSFNDAGINTLINVVATILRKVIVSSTYDTESYSASSAFLENIILDIPNLLISFINNLLLNNGNEVNDHHYIKRDFLSNFIVSILQPRSYTSNLQLALGIYIYRKTGSRLIIDLLTKLGVCASYHNIQLHEASSIMDPPKMNIDDAFVQYVFDNTDHNVSTLSGRETFHCLGGIAVYTPEFEVTYEGGSKKCKSMPPASVLASQKTIGIVSCGVFNTQTLETIKFVDTKSLKLGNPPLLPPSYCTYLWAKTLKIPQISSWKGFLEVLSRDVAYSVSHVSCLPFINLPPSNFTTLNTSLHYAAAECKKINQKTCFVTYDQPLYIKARAIVAQLENVQLKNVVVRLGGFHMLMSYLGAIGYIMDESGLEDLWSVCYAAESIKKMLTGHAFSRALRAHILSFTAIGINICKMVDSTEDDTEFIKNFFGQWSTEPALLGDCNVEQHISSATNKFLEMLNILENRGPTAKLWVQYFKCITIALQFIEAERLGNWELHLQSVEKMLPLFHAAGHFAYAKSAQIYLQDMANLDTVMDPIEYDRFTKEGYFTIHRTDKAWSGVWSDMVIEQTLNRFFGIDLKHGRGVTPSVVSRYLLGMPTAFNIMENMEDYCGLRSSTSEQHEDLSQGRMKRDNEDLVKLVYWIENHEPFKHRTSLISLSTGVIGGSNINCNSAIEIGEKAMASMVEKNVNKVSLSTIHKVKTLGTARNQMHVNSENIIPIDSTLLFQRIFASFDGNTDEVKEALAYELSPYPLSLLDERGYMRKTTKSELYKVMKETPKSELCLLMHCLYVVDGGWLLHRVGWPHGQTYGQIFHLYYNYVVQCFGLNATVVFDGYSNEIIGVKSYERYRRREKNYAADIVISEENVITLTQTKFLSNIANKFKFVTLLSEYLNRNKISVKIADEDADILIVRTAIEINETTRKDVTIVGNDIDLLVLAIAYTSDSHISLYFSKMSSGKARNVLYTISDQKHLRSFILFAHAFAGCKKYHYTFAAKPRFTRNDFYFL